MATLLVRHSKVVRLLRESSEIMRQHAAISKHNGKVCCAQGLYSTIAVGETKLHIQ